MTQTPSAEISRIIEQKLAALDISPQQQNVGSIMTLKDGITDIHGLSDVMVGEMLSFEDGTIGIALNLKEESVGAVILSNNHNLSEGQTVKRTQKILSVPVGEALLGRVVNALGEPIDEKGPIETKSALPIEQIAPGVISRQSVNQPLQTGIKAIDAMTPIGRGQRELIIGDRQTGKTTIAIDTILNQAKTGVRCIYVAIGQKASSVAHIVHTLEAHGVLEQTIVVVASAAEAAALQYIAPYAGCAMGEYFRDRGEDALIVYDDLSKHAAAYRQISLLLRRPPGREAFPGDIFYLHSRLLERAARVNEAYVTQSTDGQVTGKTGSLTALPIVETQAGDVSAFIPTNVISITDGQIYLDTDLFNAGIRPAINSGLSVSRVGGAAQEAIIKKLGGQTRIQLAQYRELEAFSQFASDLDSATRQQLNNGKRTTELMKQAQNQPLSVVNMAISLYLCEQADRLSHIPNEQLSIFESKLHQYITDHQSNLHQQIDKTRKLSDTIREQLSQALDAFLNHHWSSK